MGRAKDKSRMWKLVAKVKQPQCKDEVAMGVCKTVNFEREGVITSVEVKYECDGMNDQSVMEGNSSKEAELNKTSRQTKAKQIHAPLISLKKTEWSLLNLLNILRGKTAMECKSTEQAKKH